MFKKLLALVLVLMMVGVAACAEPVMGGWSAAESTAVTPDASAALQKALEGFVGSNIEPVALLGTQVVQGTNYAILCKVTPVVPDAVPHYAIVYINEFGDTCNLLAIDDIELGLDDEECEACNAEFDFSVFTGKSFSFCSGVGGWMTTLTFGEDGAFTGEFHDSEMGETADEYPNGTIYVCSFSGQLYADEQLNEGVWLMGFSLEVAEAEDRIEDGVRYAVGQPYGLEDTEELLVFAPGVPVSSLPYGFVFWSHIMEDSDTYTETLPVWGLYNEAGDCGFVMD